METGKGLMSDQGVMVVMDKSEKDMRSTKVTKDGIEAQLRICIRYGVTQVVLTDGSHTPKGGEDGEDLVGWGAYWGSHVTGGRMTGGDNFDAELQGH